MKSPMSFSHLFDRIRTILLKKYEEPINKGVFKTSYITQSTYREFIIYRQTFPNDPEIS